MNDEPTMHTTHEILAASDAGHYFSGATLLDPNGDTWMCAYFKDMDGGAPELLPNSFSDLVIIEYGPDAGSVIRQTGITLDYWLCREFRHTDGGFLAYAIDSSGRPPAQFVDPHMRSRFIELDSNYQLVDGCMAALDAGFCVIDPRDVRSGWCDALTHDEVLRYDSWSSAPHSFFRHDGGVTVIADVQGHLVVGVNEEHAGDGYARYDVGWLRDGGFELIRANQVVPVGYGPWSTDTAAFTFIRPDVQGWDVVEVRYECP